MHRLVEHTSLPPSMRGRLSFPRKRESTDLSPLTAVILEQVRNLVCLEGSLSDIHSKVFEIGLLRL